LIHKKLLLAVYRRFGGFLKNPNFSLPLPNEKLFSSAGSPFCALFFANGGSRKRGGNEKASLG
jgi:hypothetical protein